MKDISTVYVERNLAVLAYLKETNSECGYCYDETIQMHYIWAESEHGHIGWHVDGWLVPDWLDEKEPEYSEHSTKTKNARVAELVGIKNEFLNSQIGRWGFEEIENEDEDATT